MTEASQAGLYKRVMVKLSGEALTGPDDHGLHAPTLSRIAADLVDAAKLGTEIAVAVGGGNFFRGMQGADKGIERARADSIGMLATVMNALAIEAAVEAEGHAARALSAVPMPSLCQPYSRQAALHHLAKGRICILAGGTGNPFFTTDTAAALRASEVRAEAILMAKNGTDGVYDKDPRQHSDAVKFDRISYADAIDRRLKVMDLTAMAFCMENNMPIVVFDINVPGNIQRVAEGTRIGTLVAKDA